MHMLQPTSPMFWNLEMIRSEGQSPHECDQYPLKRNSRDSLPIFPGETDKMMAIYEPGNKLSGDNRKFIGAFIFPASRVTRNLCSL